VAQFFFWFFIADVILLGWLGAQLVEYPYVIIGQIATFIYFAYFLVIVPALSLLESRSLTL
jgi:ubiquinol-cytochrome c reductase cytochrome b subunit